MKNCLSTVSYDYDYPRIKPQPSQQTNAQLLLLGLSWQPLQYLLYHKLFSQVHR
jgi:hypothetical protein